MHGRLSRDLLTANWDRLRELALILQNKQRVLADTQRLWEQVRGKTRQNP